MRRGERNGGYAIVSTFNTSDSLYARTSDGSQELRTALAGITLNVYHDVRIDWQPTQVDYYVDGALVASHSLALANPISADLDQMRPSILPNLLQAAQRNADRGFPDIALFEVGPVYAGDRPQDQALHATVVRRGMNAPRHWDARPRPVDAFDAKADALAVLALCGVPLANLQVEAKPPAWYHPGRAGVLRLGPAVLASFGELHPRVLKALDVEGPAVGCEVNLSLLPVPKAKPGRARPLLKIPPFQPVVRDFAFLVDEAVPADLLVRAARGADKALIAEVGVFDRFAGGVLPPGKKSIAIAVTLQPREKTMTDEEIDALGRRIVAEARRRYPGDSTAAARMIAEWDASNPAPRATLSDVADHIEHVRKIAGVDHVGIGSDFDGTGNELPAGLEDVSRFPALLAELSRRGWTEADLEKLAGENILRVMARAEEVARRLQRERLPSNRTIEELDRKPRR